MTKAMARQPAEPAKRARPTMTQPNMADVVGGLVLLAIAALLVAVAIVAATG
jgi:hypothetical protein